eukprot:10521_1
MLIMCSSQNEVLLPIGGSRSGSINRNSNAASISDSKQNDFDGNIIPKPFKWVSFILQCMPLWVIKTPNSTHTKSYYRSRCLNILMLILLSLGLGYISFVWLIWHGRLHQTSSIGFIKTIPYDIIYSLWQFLFLVKRYCGALHFANCTCFRSKCCQQSSEIKPGINADITPNTSMDLDAKFGFRYGWLYGGIYRQDKDCKVYYSVKSKFTNKVILWYIFVYILCMCCHSSLYYYYDFLAHSIQWIEGISDVLSVFVL